MYQRIFLKYVIAASLFFVGFRDFYFCPPCAAAGQEYATQRD